MNGKKFVEIFSTCFYVGKIKIMPGTLGSLLAFLFLPFITTDLLWVIIIVAIFSVGTFTSHQYSIISNISDPKEVVIDEFVAQLLVFYVVNSFFVYTDFAGVNIYFFVLSFVLFRIFDIFKPFPISVIDRKIKGGIGIMLDDLVAAIFAIIFTLLLHMLYIRCVI